MWGVSRMERVMIVFGRGVGEAIRARWSWWRTALRSYGDVRIGWKGRKRGVVRSPCLDLVGVLQL